MSDNKEPKQEKYGHWVRWVVGLVFICGMLYGNLKDLPKQVDTNTKSITIIKTQYIGIKEDVTEMKGDIKTLLRRIP